MWVQSLAPAIVSVQSLSCVQLSVTPWAAVCQAGSGAPALNSLQWVHEINSMILPQLSHQFPFPSSWFCSVSSRFRFTGPNIGDKEQAISPPCHLTSTPRPCPLWQNSTKSSRFKEVLLGGESVFKKESFFNFSIQWKNFKALEPEKIKVIYFYLLILVIIY